MIALLLTGHRPETKEALTGYYLIEAKDLNEAILVASRIPGAARQLIERIVLEGVEAAERIPDDQVSGRKARHPLVESALIGGEAMRDQIPERLRLADRREHVGRLLDWLRETGRLERTVVVLMSDHGEMLGERGLWYKMAFFEPAARVPLIASVPGRFAARRVFMVETQIAGRGSWRAAFGVVQSPRARAPGRRRQPVSARRASQG